MALAQWCRLIEICISVCVFVFVHFCFYESPKIYKYLIDEVAMMQQRNAPLVPTNSSFPNMQTTRFSKTQSTVFVAIGLHICGRRSTKTQQTQMFSLTWSCQKRFKLSCVEVPDVGFSKNVKSQFEKTKKRVDKVFTQSSKRC